MAALRGWTAASVVLVGVDCAEGSPTWVRRDGSVHVVGWGRVPDHVFKVAVRVGAK